MYQRLNDNNPLFVLARSAARPTRWWLIPIWLVLFTLAGVLGAIFPLESAEEAGLWPSAYGSTGFLLAGYLPVVVIVFLWVHIREGRSIGSLGLNPRRAPAAFLIGFLGAAILLTTAIGLMIATGYGEIGDTDSEFRGSAVLLPVLLVLAGWLVQGFAEEVMFRGWLLQNTGAQLGLVPAIAFSTLVFAVAHAFNPGVTAISIVNLFLIGVLFALIALLEGGIWAATGFHVAWNWMQSNVYGFEVSGLTIGGGSILEVRTTTDEMISGGGFGFEGSIFATVVIMIGIGLALAIAASQTASGERQH
ncbi:MAG: CPBP family intramembrane glutamic endopeptidase [Chloroflexota bacterium]